jgi:SAM-dependent methyltransferase
LSSPQPSLDPTQRFSDRVEYYVRARPRYPHAVLDFCRNELLLRPEDPIADIGSGTGILSELFLENGNPVFGVEPNDAMRLAAEKNLSGMGNFNSVNGTAEHTGLPAASFRFVTAGQAFHWFDHARARAEFQRILGPEGWVLLIWNERDAAHSSGFSAAYDTVAKEFQTEWHKGSHEKLTAPDSDALPAFFAPAKCQVKTIANSQSLDLDGLFARAFSSSHLPLPGGPGADQMVERLREIFRVHAKDGYVMQQYITKVYYGRLS